VKPANQAEFKESFRLPASTVGTLLGRGLPKAMGASGFDQADLQQYKGYYLSYYYILQATLSTDQSV
jgi:hypothetical protein